MFSSCYIYIFLPLLLRNPPNKKVSHPHIAKFAAIFCVFILSIRTKKSAFAKIRKKKTLKRDSLNFNSTIALHFYAQLRTVPVQEIYSLYLCIFLVLSFILLSCRFLIANCFNELHFLFLSYVLWLLTVNWTGMETLNP